MIDKRKLKLRGGNSLCVNFLWPQNKSIEIKYL